MSCEMHPQLAAISGGRCPICAPAPVTGPPLYRVVAADPPWEFEDSLPGAGRGAEKHYRVAPHDRIMRMQLPALADDCHLFLWRVSAMVEEAYQVVRAWGFIPKSEIVWRKTTTKGKRHFGMGRHVRAEHETCIIAVRGRPKVIDRSTRSTFDAPDLTDYDDPLHEATESSVLVAEASRVHSRKPQEFYDLVGRLCPGPYLELFGRAARPGWDVIGDQVPGAPRTLIPMPGTPAW